MSTAPDRTAPTWAVTLTTDPAAFLEQAGALLAADPVVTSVVATVTQRAAAEDAAGGPLPDHPRWWALVRDEADEAAAAGEAGGPGAVVGAAMRTAPFEPHPAYVLPMPEAAARALARSVHERGEHLGAVNGALPAARVVAEETAALVGGEVVVEEHLRLWELPGLDAVVDHDAPGRLRPAAPADVATCVAWWTAFAADAAEQGGRDGAHPMDLETEEGMARRIERGLVWLWESAQGEVVHLTAHTEAAYGVVRVGPVYTPREHRGHGYASAAVAQVTRRVLEAGDRACLFTDQANPTSNKIYAAIGYRVVAETANLLVR
ncbi:GNAT family N-acetyltransferase [Nocardioides marmotae]|uniref:GNAT family N-acetyltransferase n=1 Tax=Nocardioides marmotae TaxID=2663857 RepID=UPI0012B55A03|nr:GNAT family N-acetyltransferase [Nocardioides marmotae]MBC9734695.1 GNAT family N-acetyltransferase [Nocardioides marmotae]MTB85797.1 GNAT family N-acetyltransferase [Nocardioides marmotae]